MQDAATRFYQRYHQTYAGLIQKDVPVLDEAVLQRGNHRYSSAYAYLRAHPRLDVAELGYGGVAILEPLSRLASSYTIIDIVDRTDGAQLPPEVDMKIANLDNPFPFADATIAVVLAMMVIEHLYDPFHSFAEIARILRPGGRAFVNLPNVASIKCRLQLLRGRMPVTSAHDWFERREWDGGHLHYFTVETVRRLAALVGLAVTGIAPVGKHARIKALRPSLFCHEITFELAKS